MDDTRFWAMIEAAWQVVELKARQEFAAGKPSQDGAEKLLESLEEVIPALREQLDLLSADELLAFDRILERKLYDIDRAEIQEHTGGSDDGFLYARGFIVAIGRGYYDAVNARPSLALMDLECEEICYLAWHLHKEKFGAVPASEISRESCSHRAGWPDLG